MLDVLDVLDVFAPWRLIIPMCCVLRPCRSCVGESPLNCCTFDACDLWSGQPPSDAAHDASSVSLTHTCEHEQRTKRSMTRCGHGMNRSNYTNEPHRLLPLALALAASVRERRRRRLLRLQVAPPSSTSSPTARPCRRSRQTRPRPQRLLPRRRPLAQSQSASPQSPAPTRPRSLAQCSP